MPNSFFELAKMMNDSFRHHKIDTFFIYTFGLTGCPTTLSPFMALYMVKNGSVSLKTIKEKSIIKKDKNAEKLTIEEYRKYYTYELDFIENNFIKIKNDTFFCEQTDVFFVNENIEELDFKVGKKELKISRILKLSKSTMDYKTLTILDFRSFLLQCKIGLN